MWTTATTQPKISAANKAVIEKYFVPQIHEEVVKETTVATTPKRVIAVAVDSSPDAEYALQWALDHLINSNDQVCLINVRPYAVDGNFGRALDLYPAYSHDYNEDYVDAIENYNRDESHSLLKKFGGLVLSKGATCRGIALRGNAKEEILAKVNEIKPDMLVVGCRGLSPLKKVFLGSLSHYLVQHANVPVIVPKRQ
ncbi:UNVERIFIED_CONTAM: hypothetical protein HDU68_009226 [Siphonaria sp. JEL0065]|nr:hypothetical protein HDU68_009226 [Siphonaria sp. JEL0065]